MTRLEEIAQSNWLHCQHFHPELREFDSLPAAIENIALKQGYALSVLTIDGKAREPYPQSARAAYDFVRKPGQAAFWMKVGQYSVSARIEAMSLSRQVLIFTSYTSNEYIVWLLQEGQRRAVGKTVSLHDLTKVVTECHLFSSRVLEDWLRLHPWLPIQEDPLPIERREEVTKHWCGAFRYAEEIVPQMVPFLLSLIERDLATDLFVTTSLVCFAFHSTLRWIDATHSIFVRSDTKGNFVVSMVYDKIRRDLGTEPLKTAIDLFAKALDHLT